MKVGLEYTEAIGWTIVSREEAEKRRGGIPAPLGRKDGDMNVPAPLSLFFDDLLDAKVREFNPGYAEAEGALLGQFRHLHTDIYGNRDFVEHLRNRGKFFDPEEAAGWVVRAFSRQYGGFCVAKNAQARQILHFRVA